MFLVLADFRYFMRELLPLGAKEKAQLPGMSKRTSYDKNYRPDVHPRPRLSADEFLPSADTSARARGLVPTRT
jgi:hypothetical protein